MQNSNSNKRLYKRLLIRCVLGLIVVLLLFFVIPKIIHILFPFALAFIVAAILNPLVNKINQKLRISRRIVALVLDLLVFLSLTSLAFFLVYAVVNEAISLATNIQLNWDSIITELDGLDKSFAWLNRILPPQIMEILAGFEDSIIDFLQNASKSLLSSVISITTTFTTKAGGFFVNFIMAILAAYFVTADYDRISALIKKFVGKRINTYISLLKASVVSALGGYLKSQLLLSLTAFIFMFVALAVYGQPYALLIALCLGIIDLLPIVGTIAVLVPWGIIEFVSGNVNKGVFLIIIGIAFFLIRKVIEPKIVGSQTGLHPLAALMSTYIGLQISGVWGAILGPVTLMLIISISKSGIFDNTIADLKTLANQIFKSLNRNLQQ